MRTVRLTENEIAGHLARLLQWTQADQTILRTFAFSSFAEAITFVGQVAEVAERMDHHPDLDIRYSRVTAALTTHFVKGLTARDFDLAQACDTLAVGAAP